MNEWGGRWMNAERIIDFSSANMSHFLGLGLGLVGLGYIDCPGWGSHYMVFDIDVNQPRSQFFSKIQQGSKKIQ